MVIQLFHKEAELCTPIHSKDLVVNIFGLNIVKL